MNTYIFNNVSDCELTHIFECGQCFRWLPAGDGTGDYTGAAGSYAARVRYVENSSDNGNAYFSDDKGSCQCRKSGTLMIEATGGDEAFWHHYFDLGTDYSAIRESLIYNECRISAAAEYGYGIRILNQELFETIISFIISQNNNIPRIRKNIESLCMQYGDYIGELWGREFYAFPEPETLAGADESDLAALRLGYRAAYIRAAGEHFAEDSASGCAPRTREDVLSYLGVGPKVANCIMLFGLHDVGAFPVDTWMKHIMNDMYGFDEGDLKGMQTFAAEKFGGLAGYAQQYLFYYYRDRR